MRLERTCCCGLRIASGIYKDPKKSLRYICHKMFSEDYDAAFVLFSDSPKGKGHGNNLKNFIVDNKLGNVRESFRDNVRIWIWEVPQRATENWFNNI